MAYNSAVLWGNQANNPVKNTCQLYHNQTLRDKFRIYPFGIKMYIT